MTQLTKAARAMSAARKTFAAGPGRPKASVTGWKILTHDFRPPLQGGEPLCDGKTWPITLPNVPLDESENECGLNGGWHFCREIETGLRIGGMWRTGRPSQIVMVKTIGKWVERKDKLRSAGLSLQRIARDQEISDSVRRFSSVFGDHAERMAQSQIAWRNALARPLRDTQRVVDGLVQTLANRQLAWSLREFRDAWAARAARAAWAARAARAARAAWAAWAARAARAAWAARDARDAWAAWAAWAARDARDARDAWAALTVEFAALKGWTGTTPDLLTAGIRDAYRNGLEIAIPTGPNELGFAMTETS